MELDCDGAQPFKGALDGDAMAVVDAALSALPVDRPGVRFSDAPSLEPLLAADGQVGRIAASCLGPASRPVRAILFDKSEATNWALGWHQDRTIAVAEKVDVPGFGPWTRKAGIAHVEPPVAILEAMVTLRVHLDPVDADNAPLLIATGSHRFGRISEGEIDPLVERCGTSACLAERGDIWAYATLILHASEAARRPRRRRVLQVDYSAAELPGGMQFHGIWAIPPTGST